MLARHDHRHRQDVTLPSAPREKSAAVIFAALLALTLAVTWWVYRPGFAGVFLFDDYANLPALGAYGPVDNTTTFLRYITSGHADPTGRPLALLSFLVDAHDWPADPAPFKRTNLLLHLLNGALLGWLLLRLGAALALDATRAAVAAVFGSALWLLHPLLVSTVLYIVQREAMLPATFVLAGLIGYVSAREATAQGRRAGPMLAALSIGGATLLAVASKGNGILLPLLAWLVDVIVLSRSDATLDAGNARRIAHMRRIVLEVPSVLVLAWFAWTGAGYALHGVPEFRAWTFGERLLTEGRIVSSYIAQLLVPRPYTAGLFNDAVVVSKGLLSPPSTIVALAFIAASIAFAIAVRRRAPALALAILFYFTGHLLESTVIPLELYYEHRNYLPAMLAFWPLGIWVTGSGAVVPVRRALLVALPVLLAVLTRMNADLWGNASEQALVWAAKNPDSPRAQAYAAQTERARGRPQAAIARLRAMPAETGADIQVVLNLLGAECDLGRADPADVQRADAALRNARITGQLGYEWFGEAIARVERGPACAGLGADEIRALLDAAAANTYGTSYGRRQDNLNLRARLALALKQPDEALDDFNAAVDEKPLPQVALQQAAMLGSAGYPERALKHLEHFDRVWKPGVERVASMGALHEWMLLKQGYWTNELAALRSALASSVEAPDAARAQNR